MLNLKALRTFPSISFGSHVMIRIYDNKYMISHSGCPSDLEQDGMAFGNVVCSNENHISSVCTYECEDAYILAGNTEVMCVENNGITSWNKIPPVCAGEYRTT